MDQYVPALRRRFLEDMQIRGLQPKTQTMYLRAMRDIGPTQLCCCVRLRTLPMSRATAPSLREKNFECGSLEHPVLTEAVHNIQGA